VLLIHTSLSSLAAEPGGAAPSPDTVIDALLAALGPSGTLLIPTLSYLFVNAASPTFDARTTPTNLGAIPAAMLRRPGVLRSLHPTHSVAALGALAQELTRDHALDRTPVGPHSPFCLVRAHGGQIAFLGCGTRCNTSIHGVEEALRPAPPPYLLLKDPIRYTVVDAAGRAEEVQHLRHDFAGTGQRYERLCALVPPGAYARTQVGRGALEIFEAQPLWDAATELLTRDAGALTEQAQEGHTLKPGRDAAGNEYYSYTVG
jgi:aminoglycoside 3-N-acetyltransferase